MKSGAGDDPFADIFESEATEDESEEKSTGGASASADSSELDAGNSQSTKGEYTQATQSDKRADESGENPEIPWIFRREKVKADRDKVHQLFVRPDTDRTYRRFESDLEEAMDTDLSRLDVREAAYLVGMQHPDLVISLLESWGYNYLD